jgi:hypothetical protein
MFLLKDTFREIVTILSAQSSLPPLPIHFVWAHTTFYSDCSTQPLLLIPSIFILVPWLQIYFSIIGGTSEGYYFLLW